MGAKIEKIEGGIGISCEYCGKPIVYSDENGVFCEDRCGYGEVKESTNIVGELCQDMAKLANKWKKRFEENE